MRADYASPVVYSELNERRRWVRGADGVDQKGTRKSRKHIAMEKRWFIFLCQTNRYVYLSYRRDGLLVLRVQTYI